MSVEIWSCTNTFGRLLYNLFVATAIASDPSTEQKLRRLVIRGSNCSHMACTVIHSWLKKEAEHCMFSS